MKYSQFQKQIGSEFEQGIVRKNKAKGEHASTKIANHSYVKNQHKNDEKQRAKDRPKNPILLTLKFAAQLAFSPPCFVVSKAANGVDGRWLAWLDRRIHRRIENFRRNPMRLPSGAKGDERLSSDDHRHQTYCTAPAALFRIKNGIALHWVGRQKRNAWPLDLVYRGTGFQPVQAANTG